MSDSLKVTAYLYKQKTLSKNKENRDREAVS